MKSIKTLIANQWQQLSLSILLVIVTLSLLLFRLSTHPLKLSSTELDTYNSSLSLHKIIHNITNLPFKLAEHSVKFLFGQNVFDIRLTPVLFGAIAVLLMFYILKFWLSSWWYAALGTVIFETSSWFLHTARFNSPSILLMDGVLVLFACGIWFRHTRKRGLALAISTIVIGTVIYVPGLIYLIALGIIVERETIIHELKHNKAYVKALCGVLFLIFLAPLSIGIYKNPEVLKPIFGLPSHFLFGRSILFNFLDIFKSLFVSGSFSPAVWLGKIPVLNIFEDIMLVLGAYAFWQNKTLVRSKLLVVGLALSLVLITLSGPVNLSIIIPLIYFLIVTGVVYMLQEWFKVFPNNPVARGLGVGVLCLAILFSCNYHLREYYVAWSNSPATQKVFDQLPPSI